tara:strand:- start:432 stop:896 length:465 start_codon:yes stop_codon:yes gene_type:complete
MIKTIRRAAYSAFISIVLFSIILAGWTGYAFIAQPTKSGEIINVIEDIYEGQKSVIIDVIDLSKLLINDTSERIANENINVLTESELLTDQEYKPLLEESSILEDNGDNPLGIVIEPSSPDVSEKTLPKISLGPLDNEQSEVSMNEMEIGMDMN